MLCKNQKHKLKQQHAPWSVARLGGRVSLGHLLPWAGRREHLAQRGLHAFELLERMNHACSLLLEPQCLQLCFPQAVRAYAWNDWLNVRFYPSCCWRAMCAPDPVSPNSSSFQCVTSTCRGRVQGFGQHGCPAERPAFMSEISSMLLSLWPDFIIPDWSVFSLIISVLASPHLSLPARLQPLVLWSYLFLAVPQFRDGVWRPERRCRCTAVSVCPRAAQSFPCLPSTTTNESAASC